jgi:Ca2+-binding RTX toxin-like protein
MALRRGTRGDDTITGTPTADIIVPGRGNDTLTGGAGRDVFVFYPGDFNAADVDRITDFNPAEDFIWFRFGGVHYATGQYFEDYSDTELDGLMINAYDEIGQHLTIKLVGLLDYFQLPPGTIV